MNKKRYWNAILCVSVLDKLFQVCANCYVLVVTACFKCFCFFLMLRSCLLPYKANKDILCYTEIAISSKPEKVSVITVSLGNVRKLLISLNVQASNFTELLNIIESLDVVAVEWALLNNMHQAMDPLSPVHTGDYSRRIQRLSPKTATVAEFGDKVSPSRQCRHGFRYLPVSAVHD